MLPGYEWTYATATVRDHRTVISQAAGLPLLRYTDVEGDPMVALARHAELTGALLHPHHERWTLIDAPTELNLEVCSGWGVHMADSAYRQKVHDVLAAGRRRGFCGRK